MEENQYFDINRCISSKCTVPPFLRQLIKKETQESHVLMDPLRELISSSAPQSKKDLSPFLFNAETGTLNIVPPSLRLLKELNSFPDFIPKERIRLTRLEKCFNRIREAQQNEIYYVLSEEEDFTINFAKIEIQYQLFMNYQNTYISRQFFELLVSNNSVTSQFNQKVVIQRIYFNLQCYSHLSYAIQSMAINKELYNLLYSPPPRDQELIYNKIQKSAFKQKNLINMKKKLGLIEPQLITLESQKKKIARGKLYYQPKLQHVEKRYYSKDKDYYFTTLGKQVININTGKTLCHSNLIFEKKRVQIEVDRWASIRRQQFFQKCHNQKSPLSEDQISQSQSNSTADTENESEQSRQEVDNSFKSPPQLDFVEESFNQLIRRHLLEKNIFPSSISIEEFIKFQQEKGKYYRQKWVIQQLRKIRKLEKLKFPSLEIQDQYHELKNLINQMDLTREIDYKFINLIKDSKDLPLSYLSQLKTAHQIEGAILAQGEPFITKWFTFNYEVSQFTLRKKIFNHLDFKRIYAVKRLNKIQQLIFKLEKKILKKISQYPAQVQTNPPPESEESDELLQILLSDFQNLEKYEQDIYQQEKVHLIPQKDVTIIQGQSLVRIKDESSKIMSQNERINYRERITNEL